jgi:RNA polymerase sigma-70 factor, ECF subfamily
MEALSKENIERAARGDIEAFEAIYKAASGFVYNTALRIINNGADAQEVTQDVFIRIYDNLKYFGFRSNFKTWAYRITVNVAINAYKRKMRETGRKADFDTAVETQGHPPEVIEITGKADAEKILFSLLNRLTPEQRAVMVLREIEGLSYQDISASLKINLNTVRSRIKRARETLLGYGKRAVKNEL